MTAVDERHDGDGGGYAFGIARASVYRRRSQHDHRRIGGALDARDLSDRARRCMSAFVVAKQESLAPRLGRSSR